MTLSNFGRTWMLAQPDTVTLQVKTAEVKNAVVEPSRTVEPAVQPHPPESPSVTATAAENLIPVSVLDTDLDDFITLLVDSNINISTDAMWDPIDMVVRWRQHLAATNCRRRSPSSSLRKSLLASERTCSLARSRAFFARRTSFMDPHLGHLNPSHNREREREGGREGTRGGRRVKVWRVSSLETLKCWGEKRGGRSACVRVRGHQGEGWEVENMFVRACACDVIFIINPRYGARDSSTDVRPKAHNMAVSCLSCRNLF